MDAGSGGKVPPAAKHEHRLRRKLFHLALGTILILLFLGNGDLRWPLYLVLLMGLALSYVQERWPWRPLTWLLDRYDKDSDRVPGQGPITFFLGVLVAWSLFPAEAAFGAMVALTFGDPIAYLVGTMVGGRRLPWNANKTWTGTLAFIVVPAVVLVPILGPLPGLMMPVAGALVESLRLPKHLVLDDNVTIPIAAAAVGTPLVMLMGLT